MQNCREMKTILWDSTFKTKFCVNTCKGALNVATKQKLFFFLG